MKWDGAEHVKVMRRSFGWWWWCPCCMGGDAYSTQPIAMAFASRHAKWHKEGRPMAVKR